MLIKVKKKNFSELSPRLLAYMSHTIQCVQTPQYGFCRSFLLTFMTVWWHNIYYSESRPDDKNDVYFENDTAP